ncbi:MAG: putative Fe-S cluster assembly protein SufT [Mariprofundaceae bacterium]|nr:putative Fe-S cluster assembly protein SufT [Mariprofundaceae bacterium]
MKGDLIHVIADCPASHVPMGTPVQLPAGTQAMVVQELGGSMTLNVNGNMVSVSGENFPALGLAQPELHSDMCADDPLDEAQVTTVLKTCFDPEIPVNIFDLGLIYDIHVVDLDEGGYGVDIIMTLTAAGCGMGPFIVDDVRYKLKQLPQVKEVDIELVFEPEWNKHMMSDAAQLELGMF